MRDITPRDTITDMVAGIRIEVTDIRIAAGTTTDGVIGIATLEAALSYGFMCARSLLFSRHMRSIISVSRTAFWCITTVQGSV